MNAWRPRSAAESLETIIMSGYRVLPAGDTALVVEFGDRIDRGLNNKVLALARRLDEAQIDGIVEAVPTFRSLMVHYEPLVVPFAALAARIATLMQDLRAGETAGQRLAAAGVLRREPRARSRRCRGAHESLAGAGDRAAQRGRLSRLHARLPAGPSLHGRRRARACAAAARIAAHEDPGRLARHRDDA